ncbi:WD40 repeat domain-containing protein [Streptomyces sp. SP18CS02]|uniref:WD40 repeat domain-containing protein n=1 Tax=Streptomyces sp. SP18CS02 TaxID=3002531 RepID=UPI002E770CBC|nr:hypothetical protein [Streptomyces sp. SP18CS02]MEE1756603.1 hypothetical protein [Streptomyces sp. SP18CS02]
MRAAVWELANQLGVVAATPGELLSAALLTDARRTVRVELPSPHPRDVTGLVDSLRTLGHLRVELGTRPSPAAGAARPAPFDLRDPAAVCAAGPLGVTAAYEAMADGDDHGGLRPAWLRAGQSLIRDQEPAARALVLLAALTDGADPRTRDTLKELAAGADWSVRWSRARGDASAPWPGPVAALTTGGGRLLMADRLGTVRSLGAPGEGTPDRVTPGGPRVKALAALTDGRSGDPTLLLLDERGRLHVRGAPAPRLVTAVATTLERHPGTSLAVTAGAVVVGDRTGSVHAFGPQGLHQEAPHSGRVTALAAVDAPAPLVYSGGTDGTVRAWSPGGPALRDPIARRPYPVVALHAAPTPTGPAVAVAWNDGLVALHRPGPGRRDGAARHFRPGPPVRALAVLPDGSLVVGTDEALVCLRPR